MAQPQAVSWASFYLAFLQSSLERVPREQVFVIKAKGQSLALPFPDSVLLGVSSAPWYDGGVQRHRVWGAGLSSSFPRMDTPVLGLSWD